MSHRPDVALAIRDTINISLTYLGQRISRGGSSGGGGGDSGLVAPLCSSAAAVAVRHGGGGIAELVEVARSSLAASNGGPSSQNSNLIPSIALVVLSCLPEEAQASDMGAAEVDKALYSSVGQALEATYVSLVRSLSGGANSDIPTCLKVLEHWCGPCHVTLSQLNVPLAVADAGVVGDQPSFLTLLVRILSD
eukprot:6321489-Ditylum_brightwellii.AAC.1